MSAIKKTPIKKKGLSLQQIQAEILEIWKACDAGKDIDERRLDELLKMQEAHPDYQAYVECERKHWLESVSEFCQQCLERTRSFIPVNIFETSVDDLINLGLSSEIARRIIQKKCLWLVRMPKEEIARLHESDLIGRFNSMQQHLDIIETAAVYASLPDKFPVDPLGRKAEWRKMIEDNLRQMLLDNDEDKLPDDKIRSPIYNDLQYGPILDMYTVREVRITKAEDINKTRREIEGITVNENGTSMFSMNSRPSSMLRPSQQDVFASSSSINGVTADYVIIGQHGVKTKAQHEDETEDYGSAIITEPFLENIAGSNESTGVYEGQEAITSSEDQSPSEEEGEIVQEVQGQGEETANTTDEGYENKVTTETDGASMGDATEATVAAEEESNQPATESEVVVEQNETVAAQSAGDNMTDSVSTIVSEIIESVVTTAAGGSGMQEKDDDSIPHSDMVDVEIPSETINVAVSEGAEETGLKNTQPSEQLTVQQVVLNEKVASPNGTSTNEPSETEASTITTSNATEALDLSIDLNTVDDEDD
jgi:hypothetical protein